MLQLKIIIKYYLNNYKPTLSMAAKIQSLEQCISMLQNNQKMSERKTIKVVTKIVKHFSQYTKDTDNLPPQTLIPCALFVIPSKLCSLLKIKQDQPLDTEPEHKGLQLVLQTYLKSMIKLLQKCDQQIKHVIIQGLRKSILLTVPYPKFSRKWLKQLITIWAAEFNNINLSLRAFVAINKILGVINDQIFMWALRRSYVLYFENSKQVSWRNLQHVNFMINCFCELAKINESRTYYVLFGYIRSIALQMANLNKSKRKEKVDLVNKLYSNQILNCFRLFTAVVSRVNSEELTSLIYPLVELTVAYEKISQATEFLPLKLHLLTNLLTIMESTGVYIPSIIQIVQNLLKNKLFSKKLSKKAQKLGGDLQLSYRLSPTDLSNTNLINQIFQSTAHKIYWFVSITQKLVGGSQIIKKLSNNLKNLQYSFSGYKIQISQLIKTFKNDSYSHYKLRASKHISILDKKGTELLEKVLLSQDFESIIKYSQLRQQREQLLKKKLIAENQQGADEDEAKDNDVPQEDDQVNSGWEEAQEGASEFNDEEEIKRQRQQQFSDQEEEDQLMDEQEQLNYEGDPDEQAAEQAIKQWSQAEWSSQDQM